MHSKESKVAAVSSWWNQGGSTDCKDEIKLLVAINLRVQVDKKRSAYVALAIALMPAPFGII
jgi:hypothetical protein